MSKAPVDVFAVSDTAAGETVIVAFASVTALSAIFAVVIAPSAISAVETPPSPSPLAVILSIAIVIYPLM
jgi:hypothetical protein